MASSGANGATSSSYTVPLFINGKEVCTTTTFPVVAPATSETLWQASGASVEDAIAAADAAQAAFPAWSATKPSQRRAILLKAANLLEARKDECHDYMMRETGAALPFSDFNTGVAVEMLRDISGRIAQALQGEVPVCMQEGTSALVLKEPFGVVVGIAPWNAPYILGLRAFIYALAVGNTVVFKGSELSPRCFHVLGQVMHEAGLPPGALNVLYHRPADAAAVTTALIEHRAVKKLNFTGSTAVGSIVAAGAGKNLKPVLMELGGKASAIVCDDADLQQAATQCALGAFLHSGQICMSTERILVARAALPGFRAALTTAVDALFPAAEPCVLVAAAAVDKNKRLVADAVAKGATLAHGDPHIQSASRTRLAPIVVEAVAQPMDLYHTESFGPTVSLIAFDADADAVRIANDSPYGLSAAVFSRDLARALRLARQIDSGAVHINSMTVHDEPNLPHGGVKGSGWGRFNARWGLDEFLRTKTVTFLD